MSTAAVSVSSDTDVETAARIMQKSQMRRILVTDEKDAVIGIVSQADIARAGFRQMGETLEKISKSSERPSHPERKKS